jgi:hypothetical protein
MNSAKYFIVIFISLAITACGGGSENSTDVPPPASESTPPVEMSIFTLGNSPDIAIVMMLMGEGVIDVTELIEAEFLWFYHAPQGIYTRDCLEGGKVVWDLASENKIFNSGKLTFINCLNEAPHSGNDEPQPSVFNGEVNIRFDVTQHAARLEYTNQNTIMTVALSMSSSELLISEYGDNAGIPISFSLTSRIEQDWEDGSATNLQSAKKIKTVDISKFAVPFYDNQSEQLNQGSMTQYESYTPNEDGFQYHYTLSAAYKSEKYAFEGSLSGEISLDELVQNQDYSSRNISGTYVLTTGTENITTVLNNESLTIHSTSGYSGGASTYQILDEINFRLIDNNGMYINLQKRTPFVFVDFEQSIQTDGYVAVIFNKNLELNSVSYIQHPFAWRFDDDSVDGNRLLIPALAIETMMEVFNIHDIDLMVLGYSASARFFQPTQRAEGVFASVKEAKGTILDLDDTGNYISSLPSRNELIRSQIFLDYSILTKFNEFGDKIAEKRFEHQLRNICVDPSADKLFAIRTAPDTPFQLLGLDSNFNIESETDLSVEPINPIQVTCNNSSITILDVEFSQSFFKFSSQELIEFEPYSYLSLFGNQSFVLNPTNDNQVFVLHEYGYPINSEEFQPGFRIGVVDYENSPATATSLDIEESQMYYLGPNPSFINNFQVFADELRNTLSFSNIVIDLENENQVLHRFTEVSDNGEVEYVRYLNSASGIIVTSHAIYDADDFAKLFDLPYIARSFTAERWFVDGKGRLNLFLDKFGSTIRNKNIIYQTPVLRQ